MIRVVVTRATWEKVLKNVRARQMPPEEKPQASEDKRQLIANWIELFPLGLFPILHLDHIYYEGRVDVVGVELLRTRLSLVASDHLPLVADVRIG